MKFKSIITLILVFIGLPMAIYAFGDFPRRSVLKEAISVITIISFFVMLLQFYLSRFNKDLDKKVKKSKLINWHKVLGYVFVSVLLLHPFLIALPQYTNQGLTPWEAFGSLVGEWNSYGVSMGMIAWLLMFVIGLLSAFRNRLKMKYTSWRLLHGWMSLAFVVVAALHVISLGRHINTPMDITIAVIVVGIVWMTFNTYVKPQKKKAL